ncbi:MAG: 50S ribosomal protein L11 methyltransferase [Paracoccaceae bacterium]
MICVEAAGFDHTELQAAAPFDLIFANILKGPLIELAPDIKNASAAGGYVILSGILTTQADEIVSIYQSIGYNLAEREDIVDWSTLTLEKNRR